MSRGSPRWMKGGHGAVSPSGEGRGRVREGRGIDPSVLEAGGRTGHWGIRGMKERARRIGAALDIWTGAGVGTEVSLKIPAAVAYLEPRLRSHRWWSRWRIGRSSTSEPL
jgi:hypothetical protein